MVTNAVMCCFLREKEREDIKMKKEKEILKLIGRVCVTIMIPLLVIPLCITIKPAKFLDEEAAYYLENKDFAKIIGKITNQAGRFQCVLLF